MHQIVVDNSLHGGYRQVTHSIHHYDHCTVTHWLPDSPFYLSNAKKKKIVLRLVSTQA